LNRLFVPHVTVPLPEYPVLQVTVTVSVVVPVMLPAVALSELTMLPVGVQDLAAQVNELNRLFVPHVTVPLPEYPALHVTAVV